MAVSEVKIAKNRDQNREEDENSRPGKIRSEIRSTGPVTGQPGVESGQPGGKPGSSQKFVRLCSGAMHPVDRAGRSGGRSNRALGRAGVCSCGFSSGGFSCRSGGFSGDAGSCC